METLTAFFGWCTLINSALLIVSTVMLLAMRDRVSSMHAKLFGMEASELRGKYFNYLAYYKLAILVFNLVPYLALRMVAG